MVKGTITAGQSGAWARGLEPELAPRAVVSKRPVGRRAHHAMHRLVGQLGEALEHVGADQPEVPHARTLRDTQGAYRGWGQIGAKKYAKLPPFKPNPSLSPPVRKANDCPGLCIPQPDPSVTGDLTPSSLPPVATPAEATGALIGAASC